MSIIRRSFLGMTAMVYRWGARPLLFRVSAQAAHQRMLGTFARLDNSRLAVSALRFIHNLAFEKYPVTIGGGVFLFQPMILAAGLVKGIGFVNETDALAAVSAGKNIIPGWRSIPALVGLAEFGSFTRYPRLGNPGVVIWRDSATQSTQNRVGLTNPGVEAAAVFLARHKAHLPEQFGVNIAVNPEVNAAEQQQQEIAESIAAFLNNGVYPTWFALNLSCPNTAADPLRNQTADQARQLCRVAVAAIQVHRPEIPLWVKISPALGDDQYRTLLSVFQEIGVRAVIATNTLPALAPDGSGLIAGIGGGRLYPEALHAVDILMQEKEQRGYNVDIIGCGGVIDGSTYQGYLKKGIKVIQYYSALLYRGPLAAAIIVTESRGK